MSQFLQQQTQQAASPVTSGSTQSPGSPGGHKITRTEGKKIFSDEVNTILDAVKLITVYSDKLASLPKNEKLEVAFTDQQGQRQTYQIGRQEFNNFKNQIYTRMKALPKLAFTLNKTRRKVGPNAGFEAPARFKQDVIDFFSQAELGPQVDGQFVLKTGKDGNLVNVPDNKTLQLQNGTRLNDALYFIRPQIGGQQNPLYNIVPPGTLTPIFAIHSYYANMAYPNEASYLSASPLMRSVLGDILRDTVRNDISTFISNNPGLEQQARNLEQQLIQAVDNPNILTEDGDATIAGTNIFNPNRFLYAHYSKIISAGKVTNDNPARGEIKFTDNELEQLRPQIRQVYSNIPETRQPMANFPQVYEKNVQEGVQPRVQGELPYEQVVFSNQHDSVTLSRVYKTLTNQKAVRERKKREKQAQQQQVSMGQGQQGGFQMGQMTGLPGGQQFGGVPTFGGQVTGLPGGQQFGGTPTFGGQ